MAEFLVAARSTARPDAIEPIRVMVILAGIYLPGRQLHFLEE